jgi:hypothetical protein
MVKNTTKEAWDEYRKNELIKALPIIEELGFNIDQEQVHIDGERHLMSGFKLVLTGYQENNKKRVIIKLSSHPDGIKEIEHEHKTRKTILNIDFSYRSFFLPKEILFTKSGNYTISVTSYVEQEKSFLVHDLKNQFFLALRALETQEGTHITTYYHKKSIQEAFGIINATDYINSFEKFKETSLKNYPKNQELKNIFNKASKFLSSNKKTIEKYCDFLTHSDFCPHNIRVKDHEMYLLDHTSIYFGNKYESWARFINYMVIYNPDLEQALMIYIKQNRDEEEYLSLQLMRAYKIGFLLKYYTDSLSKTTGDLNLLTKERIIFWIKVLENILNNKQPPKELIKKYKLSRDSLRSKEEKRRQKKLQQIQ